MSSSTRSSLTDSPRLPIPDRSLSWQLRTREMTFSRLPRLMGIINVTPDSFSDGGRFLDPRAAVDHALQLEAEGVDILDIGGESTRPYAAVVPVDEELRRVLPVVAAIRERVRVPISIDTSRSQVARESIAAGAEIINDVTGFEGDPAMIGVAIQTGAGICAMHMQGTPQTMQINPQYQDVVGDIIEYLRLRRDTLIAAGVEPSRLCLDPGIGFGKTHQHNLSLLANAYRFHTLGHPVLIGHSRKGFIEKISGMKGGDRLPGTIGSSISLALQGVQIIRVHDVAPMREALLLFEASGGFTAVPR